MSKEAILAQLAEHRIRNAGVRGSIPRDGSSLSGPKILTTSMIAYAARFLWTSARGFRMCPWRSPYLRWRIETYTGIPAGEITCGIFFREVWKARREFWQVLKWGAEMQRLERSRTAQAR